MVFDYSTNTIAQASQVLTFPTKLGLGEKMDTFTYFFCGPFLKDKNVVLSSKIFAISNAAGHMRSNETSCATGLFGVGNSKVQGKHGNTSLGDLATIVCSYDSTAGYSSNSLSSYFHDIGWRDRINDVVLRSWLGVSTDQTLGGNYGEKTPSDLGFTASESDTGLECGMEKDPWPTVYSNSITALTAAELTRRIALHREVPYDLQFPENEWRDMQEILYGAEVSTLFPGQQWGGMSSDTAIFLQSASQMSGLLTKNKDVIQNGQWRIFSKLGAGYSSSRYVGEIVSNAYACIPAYDSDGTTVIGGLEFTIAARGSIAQDSSLVSVEQHVRDAVSNAVDFVVSLEKASSI